MTCTPDLATFLKLVEPGVAIPVVVELASTELDPLVAFGRVARGSSHAALLETREASSADADISIIAPKAVRLIDGAGALDGAQAACADRVADIGIPLPRFVGGVIGMLGHEFVSTLEPRVPRAAGQHPASTPDACLLQVDTMLVYEHRMRRVLAIHTVRVPDALVGFDAAAAHADACAELQRLTDAIEDPSRDEASASLPIEGDRTADPFAGVTSNMAAGAFEALVEDARELVLAGECVQIVLAQRFDRACSTDPVLVYRALRMLSPAPYHALLRLGDVHLIGASPEQLVGVADERVVTHPIAGTRPRGVTAASDQQLELELLADPKERSEHMMLVDLGRNDVARVSVAGTVRVVRLCEIERYSHVMHLVSRVEGRLLPHLHPVDALRAAFPAGTLTGAPKVRAMEHIARLEPDARGAYGGVIGYVGHGRVLDMSITIRSAVLAEGMAFVQAGAGIVAASDPATEEQETRHKARGVLAAIELAEQAAARPPQDALALAGGVAS